MSAIPISTSPILKPPNLSQRISTWSPGRAALQTLTGDPYLPKTGILPPLAIVARALHAEPTKTRNVCGLFFAGLFTHSTTVQKPIQHHKFGYICQMILASMIGIFSRIPSPHIDQQPVHVGDYHYTPPSDQDVSFGNKLRSGFSTTLIGRCSSHRYIVITPRITVP